MLEPLKQLFALMLSYGLLILANGLFTTLLSLRTKLEGFPEELIGIVMGAYYLGLFLGARYSAFIVSRVGHIRAFGVFASLVSVVPLIHMLWISPAPWLLLRLISGFSMAGLIVVTESWFNARAEDHNRGTLLSIYMVVNYLGYGAAQLLLLVDNPESYRLFTIASIIFSVSLIPVLLTRTDAPLPEPPGALRIRPVLRAAPVGFYGAFCSGLINAGFYTMGPLFAQDSGFDLQQISLFMALGVFGGLLLQTPLGRYSDRRERRKVLAGVAFCTALSCAWLAYLSLYGYPASWLLLGVFIYGSLSFSIYSLAAAHANDWGDPNRRMQTAGALLAGFGAGAVAGPLLGGAMMAQLGPAGLFIFSAVIALLFSVYSLWHRLADDRRVERQPFIPEPNLVTGAGELYQAVQEENQEAGPVVSNPQQG